MKKYCPILLLCISLLTGCNNNTASSIQQSEKFVIGNEWIALATEEDFEVNSDKQDLQKIDEQHFKLEDKTFYVETEGTQTLTLAVLDSDVCSVKVYDQINGVLTVVCEYVVSKSSDSSDCYMQCGSWTFIQHIYIKEVPLFEVRTAN